jgi:hypothetical protein
MASVTTRPGAHAPGYGLAPRWGCIRSWGRTRVECFGPKGAQVNSQGRKPLETNHDNTPDSPNGAKVTHWPPSHNPRWPKISVDIAARFVTIPIQKITNETCTGAGIQFLAPFFVSAPSPLNPKPRTLNPHRVPIMPNNSTPSYPFLTTYSSSLPPAPASPGPGRPRVLNESKVRHVLSVVARGCSLEQAARYVGCAASTIRREARRNPKFGDELRRVLVDSELFALATIREAAGRHWRAGRFLLEHSAAQRIREQNRRPLTRKQLRSFTTAIADVVESEVDDLETRQRLTERLEQVVHDINRNPTVFASPKSRRQKEKNPPPAEASLVEGASEQSAIRNPKSEIAAIQNPTQTVNQCT